MSEDEIVSISSSSSLGDVPRDSFGWEDSALGLLSLVEETPKNKQQ